MRKLLCVLSKYLLFFVLGGCIYYYIEVLHRGYSHWSMFVLGGLCFVFISIQSRHPFWKQTLPRQIMRCDCFVLCGEFITGCMVNLWKGWDVWNYVDQPLNLMGQVCLPLAAIFAGLCLVGIVLSDLLRHAVYEEPLPEYLQKYQERLKKQKKKRQQKKLLTKKY